MGNDSASLTQPSAESGGTPSAATLLELENVSMDFGRGNVLDGVNLAVERGEVHAVVGQNGSGKSTLIKILTGYHEPASTSRLLVRGESVEFGSLDRSGASHGLAIRCVHQDLGLVDGLSVVDNISLGIGYETGAGRRIKWADQVRRAQRLLATVGLEGQDPQALVADCTPLQKTKIAISRVLGAWQGDGVLILDEPTVALPESEAEVLFGLIAEFRARGIAVIYVSHRLDEIFAVADRVTVLRNGHVVTCRRVADISQDHLVGAMLGEVAEDLERNDVAQPQQTAAAGSVSAGQQHAAAGGQERAREEVLAVRNVSGHVLKDANITLAPGEVLGLAGLNGSGHDELPYILAGARRGQSGTISIGGVETSASEVSPSKMAALGVGFVPEDRGAEGVIGRMTVGNNMTLPINRKFWSRGRFRSQRERAYARRWCEQLAIEPRDDTAVVEILSGGNQQKVLLAKALATASNLLVMANPTSGVDVGARIGICAQVRETAAAGGVVVVCSTDAMDLLEMCTRVLFVVSGEVTDEVSGAAITEKAILTGISGPSGGDRA